MTDFLSIEGIILSSLPYKDSDKILTLFTPEGLMKLYVRGQYLRQQSVITPLTTGEYVYSLGKKDLHRFKEGALLNHNFKLRERIESLEGAELLIRAIHQSQWPGKAAPQLYSLFRRFLEKLPDVDDPIQLSGAFLLKVMKHEGVWQSSPRCHICKEPLAARFGGEAYCEKHALPGALALSVSEEGNLQKIVSTRSFEEIVATPLDSCRVLTLFSHAFEQ